jgi:RNA polymerase subunit RPABC4/transcription elongation factor Spt4
MDKLFYCIDCKRVIESDKECRYCKSENIGELAYGAPVSVIENKTKGKVLKIKNGEARLVIKTETGDKLIKEYSAEKLRKVL